MPNQAPQLTSSVIPEFGIEQLTTFRTHVEVSDPDGDPVSVSVWGCSIPKDSPITITARAASVPFVADRICSFMFVTATDAKGATTEALPQFGTIGLQGRYRLDVGEPRFPPHDDYVVFSVDLRQSLTQVTGTILDRWGHHGTIDPAQPGTLDAEGRFRLRFKIESDADLEVAGVLTAPWGDMRQHQLVGEGQVTGERYRDWPVKLWREARH